MENLKDIQIATFFFDGGGTSNCAQGLLMAVQESLLVS